MVRTTIDIDDAALGILRELAALENRSIGKVAGDLILEAVRRRSPEKKIRRRNGIPLLERRPGVVVTNEAIERLREAEGV